MSIKSAAENRFFFKFMSSFVPRFVYVFVFFSPVPYTRFYSQKRVHLLHSFHIDGHEIYSYRFLVFPVEKHDRLTLSRRHKSANFTIGPLVFNPSKRSWNQWPRFCFIDFYGSLAIWHKAIVAGRGQHSAFNSWKSSHFGFLYLSFAARSTQKTGRLQCTHEYHCTAEWQAHANARTSRCAHTLTLMHSCFLKS